MNRVLSLWKYARSETAVPPTPVKSMPTPPIPSPRKMNPIFQQTHYQMDSHSNHNVVHSEPATKRRKVHDTIMQHGVVANNSLNTAYNQSASFVGSNYIFSSTAPAFVPEEVETKQNPVLCELPPNIANSAPINHNSVESQSTMVENSVPPLNPTITAIPEDMCSLYEGGNDDNLHALLSAEIPSSFCDDESMKK